MRGEAPHNSRVGGSGGRAAALPPQEMRGVWGGGSPPSLMRGGLGGGSPPSKIAKSENTFVAAMYCKKLELKIHCASNCEVHEVQALGSCTLYECVHSPDREQASTIVY